MLSSLLSLTQLDAELLSAFFIFYHFRMTLSNSRSLTNSTPILEKPRPRVLCESVTVARVSSIASPSPLTLSKSCLLSLSYFSLHLQGRRDGHVPESATPLSMGTSTLSIDCHDFVEHAVAIPATAVDLREEYPSLRISSYSAGTTITIVGRYALISP